MSVAPSPPDVKPPRCFVGSMSTTDFFIFAACTAAMIPPDVPPYTTMSYGGLFVATSAHVADDVPST
jgi:hypothetical protein